MDNKETLAINNARLANINKSLKTVLDKAVFPEGSLTITKNGPYDVTQLESVSVFVEGGSFGGEYDFKIRWKEVDDMSNILGEYIATGYLSIDGGNPIYFENVSELALTDAVNADSSVTVYFHTNRYYVSASKSTTCNDVTINSDYDDGDYVVGATVVLSGFTGNASVTVEVY